ncbi:MAG: peptidylprolyl isomerase, partial [Zoogloea sp.]|nr:peptidylprolyl isomerase [Zoogloea sp.]
GSGDLAPALESCLAGVAVGQHHEFLLEPGQAFGPHRTELVEKVRLVDFPNPSEVEAMSIMEFTAPDGSRYPGLIREVVGETATVDFNHPLAGKSIRFEVEIIGVN